MTDDNRDITQLPPPMTMEQISERLSEMRPPTPIGKARFDTSRTVLERSKPAIIRDNAALLRKMDNMKQLLAALLLEREHFTDQPATFSIDELECINPRMVEMSLTDMHATLSLKEIEEEGAEADSQPPEPA